MNDWRITHLCRQPNLQEVVKNLTDCLTAEEFEELFPCGIFTEDIDEGFIRHVASFLYNRDLDKVVRYYPDEYGEEDLWQ